MSSLNVNDILGKLDELRALFVLGQRVLPFLEEMLSFFQEISPLLDEINASIRESTNKMPDATSKLQQVTTATELATTEILDLVDAALLNLAQLKERPEQSSLCAEAMAQADARLIRLLRAALKGKDDALLAKVERIYEEKKILRRSIGKEFRTDVEVINKVRDKLNHIMISLQVQDITTQQLAGVNHLIESIRGRMARLVERLGTGDPDRPIEALPAEPTGVAFDPNAEYNPSGQRQSVVDDLVASFEKQSASETG